MARKKLNKNLVLLLTLCGSVLMIGVAVVLLLQLQATDPARFAQLAESREAEGDYEGAILFYQKAWERSQDVNYLIRRGEVAVEWGELGLALECWRNAVIARPASMEARTRELNLQFEMARLYGDLNSWLAVAEKAEGMLSAEGERSTKDEAFARNAFGMALVNLASQDEENPARGLEDLERAVALDADKYEYEIDLAREYIAAERVEDGEQLFQTLTSKYAEPGAASSTCQLAYAEYRSTVDPRDDAEPYFLQSIEFAGDDADLLLKARVGYAGFISQKWARIVNESGRNEEVDALLAKAESILKQAIEDQPDSFEPYLRLSFLYQRLLQRHEDTIALCESRLSQSFSRKGVEAARNRLNVFLLNIWASEACVSLAEAEDDVTAKEEHIAKAEQYLADAKGEAPNHPLAFHQEGKLRMAQGRDRAALEAFRNADSRFRTLNRVDWDLKTTLAQLHIQLKQPGAALELLEGVMPAARASKLNDLRFWLLYAQALLETGDHRKAVSVLDPILVTNPDLQVAMQLKAAALERLGRPKQAGELISSVETAAILQARDSLNQGDTETALTILRDAHRQNPGHFRLTGTLVSELVRLKQLDEAREVIARAEAASSDPAQIRALAVWVDPDLSEQERDEKLLALIKSEGDAFQQAIDLLDFHQQRGNYEEALAALLEAQDLVARRATPQAAAAPTAAAHSLIRLKMQLALRLDDEATMVAARDEAVRGDTDGAGGKTMVGLYHMMRKEWDLAATAFRGALDIQGTDAETMGNLGECFLMLGRNDDATTYLERAVRINPRLAIAHRGLARLAKVRGDTDTHKRHLNQCRRLIPDDPWVRAELMALREQADRVSAIARREAMLKENPDDVANLRRLAALCAMEGVTEKADKYYGMLLSRDPDNRNLVVSVSSYYRQTGRPERALALAETYAAGQQDAAGQADARIVVAMHYINTGDLEAAEATLLEAAETATTLQLTRSLGEFYQRYAGRPREAVKWFDMAIAMAEAEGDAIVSRLLESKVKCYLDRNVSDLDAAQTVVQRILAHNPSSQSALLLQSEIYSRRGDIDGSIKTLSDYLVNASDDDLARFHRAKQYIATGQIGAAIDDLDMIKRHNPMALELHPRLLLAGLHFQSGRSDLWVRELESLVEDQPDSTLAVGELVRAYIQEGRWGVADQIITNRINQDDATSRATWYQYRAQVSLGLKQYAKALSDFRRAAELLDYTLPSVLDVMNTYDIAQKGDEAIAYYREHVKPENERASSVARLAHIEATSDRTNEAAHNFRRAMVMAQESPEESPGQILAEIAVAFRGSDAVAVFRGSPAEGVLARANERIVASLMYAEGDHAEAISATRALIDSAADDLERAQLLQEMAQMLAGVGRHEEARAAYESALKLDENNWMLLNNLAFHLADSMGEPLMARPYAERAVELAETAFTLDTLGWIFVGIGDYQRAVAELNQAVRLNPSSAESYYHLGEAYRRLGDFGRALDTLRRAREVAASAGDARFDDDIAASMAKVDNRDKE
ncbi:MAG: tetratricopeptide repeat protein [Planctomycetota bacterium]|jgi:tetratricopeptide (TPR) repeat protein